MSVQELDTTVHSDRRHRVPAAELHARLSDHPDHPQKNSSLLSSPSESDWVSPFTLPPLPAFRRTRSHHTEFPEQKRQRESSGVYYAAAWGSPYSSPEPKAHFAHDRAGRGSIDSSPSSPPRVDHSAPGSLNQKRHHSIDLQGVGPPTVSSRTIRVRKLQSDSERSHWLSDSESGDSDDFQKEEHTPRRRGNSADRDASPVSSATQRSHTANESIVTVTPDNFRWGLPARSKGSSLSMTSHSMALAEGGEPGPAVESTGFTYHENKPLPATPKRQGAETVESQKESNIQASLSRPRFSSMQSFQRPKKKVAWKGKTCVIALPMTDRDSIGLPPILTPQEVRDRIEALNAEGYNTNGFELVDFVKDRSNSGSGHSRPIYPDPQDLQSERQMHRYHVHIPDQGDWNQWVQWLQEEKLRALGVTPSSSEPPASTTSPFSAPLSRTSSRCAGSFASPPTAASPPASTALRAISKPFSPAFSVSSGFGSHVASGNSSQYNGFPLPTPSYKQPTNIAMTQGQSPQEFSTTQSDQLSPAVRSPLDETGRSHSRFSPINPQGIQSLGEVLSSDPVPPSAGPSPGLVANMTNYLSTPWDPQQPRSASHEPTPSSLSRPTLPHQSSSLPRTPNLDNLSRPPLEIQHPTPQSHRHNLSAALQKEIDEAEAALDSQHEAQLRPSRVLPVDDVGNDEELAPEDPLVELPILKRPETQSGGDDRSDIETNPSIAASPLLIDDKNPFANWQALSDAARADAKKPALASNMSSEGHRVQPSVSKLNIEAKEFNPSAGFDSSKFSLAAFNPFAGPSRSPMSLVRKDSDSRHISGSQFNVGAPAFRPSGPTFNPIVPAFEPGQQHPSRSFRVPSSTFNVQAPEFNPDGSPKRATKAAHQSMSESESKPASIFGKFTIDPDSKVSRRTKKALAIVRPRSKDGPSGESSTEESSFDVEEDEDEEGQPSAPSERAKRARRHDSDSERSPKYADSAPFSQNHGRILSEIVNEAESENSLNYNDEAKEKPVDGWSYIPAGTPDPTEHGTVSPLPEQEIEMAAQTSPFTFKDEQDAIRFSEARPRSYLESSIEPKEQDTEATVSEGISAALPSPQPQSAFSHKSSPFRSALAEPFTYDPPLRSLAVESQRERSPSPPGSRKLRGLGASRWATSPSPSPPPLRSARLPSPSIQYDPVVKSEHESSIEDVKVSGSLDESTKSSIPMEDDQDCFVDSRSVESHDFALKHEIRRSHAQFSEAEEEPIPSFEEIDAVMQHLDRNPELGIEREDTPFHPTPLVDPQPASTFRSDAPSPSPRRRPEPANMRHVDPSSASFSLGTGVHRLTTGKEEVSDWNDTLSATEEEKLQSRAQFFDGHVNDLVDGILENRLGPLERTLETIQHSISLMATRPQLKERRSQSTEARESDADDEDDYNAFEGYSSYRSRSPEARKSNRRASRIRAAVAEGMAAYRENLPQQPQADLSRVLDELAEMRQQMQDRQRLPQQDEQKDMRAILDEVISNHPRLRGSRVQQDHQPSESRYKIHVDGLNALLKAEQERADHETRLRKKADEEIELLKRALSDAEAGAAEHKEASDAAEQSLEAFVKEKEAYRNLEQDLELVNRKNEELEMNLDEYRKYKVELQDDVDEERDKNEQLKAILQDVKERLEDRQETCKALRGKVERLQDQMSLAVRDLGSEQARWQTRESELLTNMSTIENALDQAAHHREKTEADYHDIAKEYKEAILYKDRFNNLQYELANSQQLIATLQTESRHHQDTSFGLQKELNHLTANRDAEVATATARLNAELEGARSKLESFRTDSEARVARLQSRLDAAELDLEEQKAKHDTIISETAEAHTRALQEVAERHETTREAQQAAHQSHLTDLRERHTRAMHNSSDDKHRLEYQFNEKLSMSDDKVRHLESKLVDIEERLEITKSAARAAVEAATAKTYNLPTPANSVVASPPQRATSASLSLGRGSGMPEKIPVQSLRESIIVLQDQLQNREQSIEKLEAELAAVDKEMPNKLRDRETEATWLRELLAVRTDDIEDVIATLATPNFDREHAKDAAIRLRANIQMEQQIRERAAQSGGLTANLPLPTMSSLAAYAQSPRQSLPLAAAAAWGNFRKVRDLGGDKLSEYLGQSTIGTPSKSSLQGSPASLLSGMMTPPGTAARTPSVEREMAAPPAMRPLAAAAAARKAQNGLSYFSETQPRPLRGYSSKPRALGAKREVIAAEKAPVGGDQLESPTSPHTPVPKRASPMPVAEAEASDDLTGGFDEDASPLEGKDGKKTMVGDESGNPNIAQEDD